MGTSEDDRFNKDDSFRLFDWFITRCTFCGAQILSNGPGARLVCGWCKLHGLGGRS